MRTIFLSVFYSGKIKFAPGTFGSILGFFLGLPILFYSLNSLFLAALLIGAIAIKEIDKLEKTTNIHDPSWIVIDELVGVWIAMAIACSAYGINIIALILALVLFRVFDITKPSIIGRVDRNVKGGLGVVGDDAIAGIVAGAAALLVLGALSFYDIPLFNIESSDLLKLL